MTAMGAIIEVIGALYLSGLGLVALALIAVGIERFVRRLTKT
jgi:hypothetical protein